MRDEAVATFRVWPWDVDVSIMNHAPIMTVLETGRVDYMVRSGFFSTATRNKWYFPLASIDVQFIRPLKIFQKAMIKTKVVCIDEKWIFMQQSIVKNGKLFVTAIIKSVVKKGRDRVPYMQIAERLDLGPLPSEKPEIAAIVESEKEIFERHFAGSI